MKEYMNPEMQIWEMEEEVIRTSGLTNAGSGGDIVEGFGDGDFWENFIG